MGTARRWRKTTRWWWKATQGITIANVVGSVPSRPARPSPARGCAPCLCSLRWKVALEVAENLGIAMLRWVAGKPILFTLFAVPNLSVDHEARRSAAASAASAAASAASTPASGATSAAATTAAASARPATKTTRQWREQRRAPPFGRRRGVHARSWSWPWSWSARCDGQGARWQGARGVGAPR